MTDIAAIRERHRVTSTQNPAGPGWTPITPYCVSDDQDWPCDAAQLLALLADTPSVEPAGMGLLLDGDETLPWEHAFEADDPKAPCETCGWVGSYAHTEEFYRKWVFPALRPQWNRR